MSEAEKLKKEIEYFSVLIQKHKERNGNAGKAGSTAASQYKWSKRNTFSNASDENGGFREQGAKLRNRPAPYQSFHKSAVTRSYSTHQTAKQPPTFNPKFKWTKRKETSAKSSVSPLPSSSNVTLPKTMPSATTTSNAVVKPVATTVLKNSKFTYHKNAAMCPNPSAVPADTVKKIVPSQVRVSSRWNGSRRKTIHSQKSQRYQRYRKKANFANSKNPYKLRRNSKQAAVSYNLKSPTKPIISRHVKKTAHSEKRKKLVDSTTHITLSKAALEDLLKKHAISLKQALANKAVVKSYETNRSKKQNSDRKRQHCLYYGRFGKCMRGEDCKFIHDPTKVAICTRFLRGTCRDSSCSFSHKVEKEKIPLCLFFVRGKCTVPDCPYLHVFLGKDAPICQRFASAGFCPNGDKCKAQHIKCCPEFHETGTCGKGKSCKLPHLKLKRQGNKKTTDSRGGAEQKEMPSTSRGSAIKSLTADVVPPSSEGYLSLKVDQPAPLNVPVRSKRMTSPARNFEIPGDEIPQAQYTVFFALFVYHLKIVHQA